MNTFQPTNFKPASPRGRRLPSTAGTALCALALGLLSLAGTAANAGVITQAATRAELSANDSASWGTAADDFTSASSPYARTSAGGLGVTATNASGFYIFQQNGAAYTGNFSDGEILLSTFFAAGPIDIGFAAPVRGIGFNVAHEVTDAFIGTMSFFGAGDILFGSVSISGTTSNLNDGSAPFLGGMSSARDIVRVQVSVNEVGGSTALAINQLSLNTTDPVTTTPSTLPEPASAWLVALGLAGGLLARRPRGRELC